MSILVIAAILGLLGGVIHQLMDRAKENDIKAIIRGAIIGLAAGILTAFSIPSSTPTNLIYISIFTAGYFGDSVILNIVERTNKE